jgi:hypothetical protein
MTFSNRNGQGTSTLQRRGSTDEVNTTTYKGPFPVSSAPASKKQSHQELHGSRGATVWNDRVLVTEAGTDTNSVSKGTADTSTGGFRRVRGPVTCRSTSGRNGRLYSVQEEGGSEYEEDLQDVDERRTLRIVGDNCREICSSDEGSYLEDSMTDIESIHTENPQFIAIGIVQGASDQASNERICQDDRKQISEAVAEEIAKAEHILKMEARAMNSTVDTVRRRSAPGILTAGRSNAEHSLTKTGSPDRCERTRSSFSGANALRNTGTSPGPRKTFFYNVSKPNVHPNVVELEASSSRTSSISEAGTSCTHPSSLPMTSCRARTVRSSEMNESDRTVKMRAIQGALGEVSGSRPPRAVIPRDRTSYASTGSQPLGATRSMLMSSVSGLQGTCQNTPPTSGNSAGMKEEELKTAEDDVSVSPSLHTMQSARSARSFSSGITLDDKTTERIARSAPLRARRPPRTFSGGDRASATTVGVSTSSASFNRDKKMPGDKAASGESPRARDGKGNMHLSPRFSPTASNAFVRDNRPSDEKSLYKGQGQASSPAGVYAAQSYVRMPNPSDHKVYDYQQEYPEIDEEIPFHSCTSSDDADSEDLEAQAGVPVLLPGAFAGWL